MSEYERGTRVVVTEELPGVPEGTPGKCGRGIGFAVKRYRVRFDNGVEAISVAHGKLVHETEWPQFLARRARAEIEAATQRARAAEARAIAAESRELSAGSTEESSTSSSPAPAADADGGEESTDGGDPRLAALLARSKSAREATGVAAPESTTTESTTTTVPAIESPEPAPTPAAAQEARPSEASPVVAPTEPARSAPLGGPARIEVPEFVPGPEVGPEYAPAANRVSELLYGERKNSNDNDS